MAKQSQICQHRATEDVATHPFRGSVADLGHTEENHAAHGGVRVTVRCIECNALRAENRNGGHSEFSRWSAR